mmetsp:Transcript_50994/g.94984  ORF Transcript_50994/g.94984 Transcript_50994/m.94984 type:complete len:461 (+) Transcript_50994:660-2042(+)
MDEGPGRALGAHHRHLRRARLSLRRRVRRRLGGAAGRRHKPHDDGHGLCQQHVSAVRIRVGVRRRGVGAAAVRARRVLSSVPPGCVAGGAGCGGGALHGGCGSARDVCLPHGGAVLNPRGASPRGAARLGGEQAPGSAPRRTRRCGVQLQGDFNGAWGGGGLRGCQRGGGAGRLASVHRVPVGQAPPPAACAKHRLGFRGPCWCGQHGSAHVQWRVFFLLRRPHPGHRRASGRGGGPVASGGGDNGSVGPGTPVCGLHFLDSLLHHPASGARRHLHPRRGHDGGWNGGLAGGFGGRGDGVRGGALARGSGQLHDGPQLCSEPRWPQRAGLLPVQQRLGQPGADDNGHGGRRDSGGRPPRARSDPVVPGDGAELESGGGAAGVRPQHLPDRRQLRTFPVVPVLHGRRGGAVPHPGRPQGHHPQPRSSDHGARHPNWRIKRCRADKWRDGVFRAPRGGAGPA